MFQDPELATFTGSSLKKRIQENREFFETVKEIHDYGLGEEKLENKFSVDGSKELFKEDWKDVPFSQVHKFREDYLRDNKAIKVQISGVKAISNVEVWDRTRRNSVQPYESVTLWCLIRGRKQKLKFKHISI